MRNYVYLFTLCFALVFLCVGCKGLQNDVTTVSAQEKTESVKLFRIIKNGKFGFIDKKGNIVIEPKFDDVQDFSEDLALVTLNRKKGFIDKTGKLVIEPKDFEPINGFTDGLARGNVTNRGRYTKGYIDKSGKLVIDNQQIWGACEFSEGLACVQSGKWGFIDNTGKFVIQPQFNEAHSFVDGIAFVKIGSYDATTMIDVVGAFDTEGKWGYIDKTGKYIWQPTN